MTREIPLADSALLLRLWRYLHARRNQSSVLADSGANPDAVLLRRLTAELCKRGLL
jgi:hypothetical protein